jgi:uncharacterized protein (TIGR03435 family)
MTFDARNQFGLAIIVFAANLAAQHLVVPRFEVVAIRPVSPNSPPVMRDQNFTPVLPGGGYNNSRTPLSSLIAFAYKVKFVDMQLTGLPKWAQKELFAVAARPREDFPALPADQNTEQVRLMMRAMLADRFHLKLHTETRKGSMYSLEVAPGGIKTREVDPPVPPAKEGFVNAAWSDDDIRIIGKKSTTSGFATALTIMLHTMVVDQTGSKSYYNFDVNWRNPDVSVDHAGAGFSTEGVGFLISNLRSTFGLQLTRTTGLKEYWVVDHVEPPTAN